MRMSHKTRLRCALFFVFACHGVSAATLAAQPIACGTQWINLHRNNPDLVGIYVQQLPDNKADQAAYRGRHPSMIIYLFKAGRAHQVSYTPSGQIEEGFWWSAEPGHWIYAKVSKDFREDVFCHFSIKK